MAKRKNYMVCKFETKEDFDRHFNSIYRPGYSKGHEDGVADALSLIFDLLNKFPPEILQQAEYMSHKREIAKYQKPIKEKE